MFYKRRVFENLKTYLTTVFTKRFSIFHNEKTKKLFSIFYFLFSKIENIVFLNNIYLLFFNVFTCFLRDILNNNYINMYND